MYATYNIHTSTLSLEFIQVFNSRQEATNHLRKDAETHLSKLYNNYRWIQRESELNTMPEGYYLRSCSVEGPNKIIAYEVSTTLLKGYLYNSTRREISKLYIYSIIEVPQETIVRETDISRVSRIGVGGVSNKPLSEQTIELYKEEPDSYLAELKTRLHTRRLALTGLKSSLV
jgi:hypothetical protein